MTVFLQILCSFLLAVSLLFIVIELRSRYDKSFLYFGVSLAFLCALTSIDLWVLPAADSLEKSLYWQKIFHVISVALIPLLIWHIMLLTHSPDGRLMKWLIIGIVVVSFLFLTDHMMHIEKGQIKTSLLYVAIFFPFAVFSMVTFLALIIKKLGKVAVPERKILKFYLVGFSCLVACGCADLAIAAFVGQNKLPIKSFTIVGVFFYGIASSFVFTERFLLLLNDRSKAYADLENAYRDLEEVNALKQIGESSAIINHEIKNYMFMISGQAELLIKKGNLKSQELRRAEGIAKAVKRLQTFSQDILDLTRSRIVREKTPINICSLIERCIDENFQSSKDSFGLTGLDKEIYIYGDWEKLEHVFVNIFKNSIEAAGESDIQIRVRIISKEGIILITVDDNGMGCNQEQLQGLFKAFYTTKKGKMGTGLGMSITRTIIEGHGGHISAYSKNLESVGGHGLQLQISLPDFREKEVGEDRKHPIVVVKKGLRNIEKFIRVFQNVNVNPHMVQDLAELERSKIPYGSVKVILSNEEVKRSPKHVLSYESLFIVSEYNSLLYVLDRSSQEEPKTFSEEFVVSRML